MTTQRACHTLEMMPETVARGVLARKAWDRWVTTAANRAGSFVALQFPHPAAAAKHRPSAPEQVAPLAVGTGVWVMCRLLRHAGCEWLRGQVLGTDALTGRYLVANIDNPRAQWYAARTDLVPRYVGEVAPGITCPDLARPTRWMTPHRPTSGGAA